MTTKYGDRVNAALGHYPPVAREAMLLALRNQLDILGQWLRSHGNMAALYQRNRAQHTALEKLIAELSAI